MGNIHRGLICMGLALLAFISSSQLTNLGNAFLYAGVVGGAFLLAALSTATMNKLMTSQIHDMLKAFCPAIFCFAPFFIVWFPVSSWTFRWQFSPGAPKGSETLIWFGACNVSLVLALLVPLFTDVLAMRRERTKKIEPQD